MKRTVLALVALVAAALLGGVPVAAFASTGLTIQPIKVSQTLSPGANVSGAIALTNASDGDVEVEVKIEDFIPTAGEATFQFVGRTEGVTSVRDWVEIDGPTKFAFKKGETKNVAYTIRAPKDAQPGSHFGVLFFKATNAADVDAQIKVGTQVGVLVFVTIPGDYRQEGSIRDLAVPGFVTGGPIEMELSFENTGTVYFEPKGEIKVTNMFGNQVGSVPIEGYAVLPTGLRTMNFNWAVSGPMIGRYVATATVLDPEGKVVSEKSSVFWALPVWYVVGFLALAAFLFFGLRFVKRKLRITVSFRQP